MKILQHSTHLAQTPCARIPRAAAPALLIVLLLALLAARETQADAVDDLVGSELRRRNLPGVSVAVVRDGQTIKTGAYGFADLELGVAATTRTVFQIQSITKTFTSTAILLLVEEGKLSLDDPVGKHLEGTPATWKGITLRHLLSHTSGIKDFINEPTTSLRIDVTEEEVLQATAPRPLNFAPGEKYAYSNTNYHLLAMILRKLTGKAYGDVLTERIFLPLGMTNTRIVSLSAVIPDRASGYLSTGTRHRKGEFIAESILSYGGGGILSTGPDMARWAHAMLEGKVLRPATLADAWTPVRLNDGSATGYGLGWGVARIQGHREIGHTGGHATGFTSSLVIYPDDKLAVVVLQNCGGKNAADLARRVAGLYVPALTPVPAAPIADAEPGTAELLRELIAQGADGSWREDRFTPDLWKVLQAQKAAITAEARTFGALRSLDLLSRSRTDAGTTSRYRATFAARALVFALTLDRDGRISGLQSTGEE